MPAHQGVHARLRRAMRGHQGVHARLRRAMREHDEVGNACVNNNNSRPLDAVAALIMLALTLSWGLNQVSIKLALPEIPPLIQATIRSAGAFIVILVWARWRGVSFT